MNNEPFKLKYVPELDGMRGIAIVAVLLFHSGASWLKGGFIGVDIFFVLSGFLITTLLLQEYDAYQAINLKNFYLRRVLRLAPALILLLVVFSIFSIVFLDVNTAKANLIDALITLFYLSNWARAFNIHPPNFLGHTWSLSIEEQFYILWPILLITFLRLIKSRKRIAYITLSLALFAWIWRVSLAIAGASIERLYNGLDTRADALLIGCALGILLPSNLLSQSRQRQLTNWLKYLVPLSGAILVYLSLALHWRNPQVYYWVLVVIELLVAILILDVFLSRSSFLKPLLSNKLLVWIGMLSYGLYLWHLPVFLTMQLMGFSEIQVILLGSLITGLIATLSYYFLERPFLKLKQKFSVKKEFE